MPREAKLLSNHLIRPLMSSGVEWIPTDTWKGIPTSQDWLILTQSQIFKKNLQIFEVKIKKKMNHLLTEEEMKILLIFKPK